MPVEHAEIEAVFAKAVAIGDPAERAAFIVKTCANNPDLQRCVEELLRSHDIAGSFLKAGETSAAPQSVQAVLEPEGTVIGRYKLLQKIGEGGFGVVYLAEQETPVRRRVALKVIKLGMDTKQVVARFEAERQALAILDHPGIAKVHDAGATETGRPYFVMELVAGVPITQYCDRQHLGIRQRLEMFVQVCQAVQHAHQKGLIHRDLKPSNVLVTTIDGRAVAKVIDFGVAKATAARLTEKTLFTEHRQLIGTPEYMSPEQAEGSLDIDTRSDVYSLGVLLYELLAGSPPFDPRELRSKAFAEMQRIIREVDPPHPSTRLSTAADLASVAAQRGIEPRQLRHAVRGELDWIVMKCLEKDRTRRYESAAALAADALHFLADEPVSAAAPSRVYKLRKFVRRNKGPVLAAATIATLLVGGIIGTTIGLIEAQRQKSEAQKQGAEAKRQAAISESTNAFLSDMLASTDPDKLLGNKVTVLQATQAAVKELDAGKLKDQPLTEAAVRSTIGNTLRALGEYDAARPNLEPALDIRRKSLPAGHLDIATSLSDLAVLLRAQGKLDQALPLFREALEMRQRALPAGHPDIATSLSDLAVLLQDQGKLDQAEPLCREALDTFRKAVPAGHPEIATSLNNLAHLLQAQGKLDQALPLFREALEIHQKALPTGHPDIAASLNNLALLLQAQGKLAEAEPLHREALETWGKTLPIGHPNIAASLNNLALLLQDQGKLAEAEPLFREALNIRQKALPAGHVLIAQSLNNLTKLLRSQGKLAEVEPLFREALEARQKDLPAGHPEIATSLNNLATLLKAQGRLAEAEPLYGEALEIRRKAFGDTAEPTTRSAGPLAELLDRTDRHAEAEAVRARHGLSPATQPATVPGAN